MSDEYKNSPDYMGANDATRTAIDNRMNELEVQFEQEQRAMEKTKGKDGWSGNPLNAWRKMNESRTAEQISEQILLPEQLEAERAVQAARLAPPQPASVVEYDELGRLKAPKKTMTTSRQQVEYLRAIKKQYGQSS